MKFAFVIASLLANNFISVDATSKFEPQCYSRFDYEYKVVEKLFTLEAAYKKQQDIIQELKDALEEMKNENKALKIEMEGLKNVSIRQEGNIIYLFIYLFIYFEHQSQKTYLLTCAPSEDSDKPVHWHSLIRIFTRRILDSRGCKVSLYVQIRL